MECQRQANPWRRADGILAQLVEIGKCCEGALQFGLDQSVDMRLNVASRVDTAMGISNLRVDRFTKSKGDFISPDSHKWVANPNCDACQPR